MIVWDSRKLNGEEVVLGLFSITIRFLRDEARSFSLTSIYGSNNTTLRRDFWQELLDLFCLTYSNWYLWGNFNVVRRSSKKLGDSRLTPSMRHFDDFIRECELIDSPLRNVSFTWSNMQEVSMCKKLDRFLFSNE